MKRIIFLTSIIVIALTGCNKLNIEKGTPKCIQNQIKDFDKNEAQAGANVAEYTFQGKTVYVFDNGNHGPDSGVDVIDSECNKIGYLGGITGNTKISGEEFSHASFVRTVWKK